MKKGDLFKLKNYKIRGLSNNCYFYCKGLLDDVPIMVRCIITQKGEILLDNTIEDISCYKDLTITSIEEFLKNKFNYEENTIIDFKNNNGIIREVMIDNQTLVVEIENEETCEYEDKIINFNDVIVVYPEFTYNNRRNFSKI